MICPKCGFSQPSDCYCANCGINIKRYVQKRKKRRFGIGIVVVLIFLSVFPIARYLKTSHHGEELTSIKEEIGGRGSETRKGFQAEREEEKPGPANLGYPQANRGRMPGGEMRKEAGKADQPGYRPGHNRGSREKFIPPEPEGYAESAGKVEKGSLTAREWFEKGKALDDDSDAEILCYQKALELDPKLAPAYYRLGAIYFRQANYDPAEKQFARFLKYASESDREAYDIYLYYSPDYLQRLSDEGVNEGKEGPSP